MKEHFITNIVQKLVIVLLLLTIEANSQCDRTFAGAVTLSTVSAGELVCTTADFSGSITVDNGGELYISHSLTGTLNIQPGGKVTVCGASVAFYGSVTIGNGGSLTLTSGTYMDMAGGTITAAGVTADGNIPFRYQGDPSCYAEVNVRATTNLGAPNANPFMNSASAGTLTNSNRIYFSGLSWNYGLSTIGSGNVGNAPSFCNPVGSCFPCTAGTVNAGGAITAICQEGTSAAMGGSIGGGATAGTWSGGAGTWTNASNPATATYTASAGESGSITLTLTATGGCSDVTATKTITVNANPTITGTTPASRCGTGTVGLGATASAGTINWYAASSGGGSLGSGTTYTTPSISATTTYYVDATSGSCTTSSRTAVTATVNANPTANAGGVMADICQGATSAALGGSVGGGATGGTWTENGTGSINNPTDLANATYTAGAGESGNVTLTLTTSGGSCGTTTATKTITINENPTADAGAAMAAICEGATSAALGVGASVGGGATGGTWSASSGTVNNPTDVASATYTADGSAGSITLTLTTSGGSCGTTTDTKTITVNENPTANAGGAATAICTGATSAALGGSYGGGATGGTWTASSGTVNNATDVANATYTGDGSTGSITLTLTTSGGSCGTTTATKNITVTANNTATAGSSSPSLCNNTLLTNITHTTTGATGISNDGTSGANGLPSGVSATWAGNTITISGTPSASGTFNYSIPLTGGCGTVNATGTITVYGSVTAGTVASNQSINVGATPSALTESVVTSGGSGAYTYQWQKSTDDGASWANAGGTDDQATYSPGALSITTWFRRIDTDGCSNTATTNIVVIDVSMSICSGSTPSSMDGDGVGGTGSAASGGAGAITYLWEKSTNNGSSWSAAEGTNNTEDYSPSSTIAQETWYRRKAIDGANGCEAYSNVLVAGINSGNPGGIGGALVWLKADAGTSALATQWDDQSGNNNHYLQATATSSLEAGDSSSNYNPYIIIQGGQGFTAPVALGSAYTMFVAAKKLSSDLTGTLVDGRTSSYSFAFSGNVTTNTVEVVTSSTIPANGVYPDINVGASTGNGCDAHLYELIIYNRLLPSDSIEIVESYLETKWGVEGADNYVSSLGNSTYDVSSYVNDIIGIGRECYFHQKQAQTEDDSVRVTVSATKSIGDMASTNSTNGQSITNDVSYLMIGHDGAKLAGTSATSSDIPPANHLSAVDNTPTTILTRIDREWKITNTNFSDPVAIKFEVIPSGLTPNDLVFMVDDDGDFTDAELYLNGEGGVTIDTGSIIIGIPAAVIGAGFKIVALASKAPASVLPVELLNFNVNKKDGYGLISWTTAAELNNSHFIVQKSVDGVVWEDLQIVQGAGNSNQEIDYSVVDYDRCELKCYYRLKQVDFDGVFKISSTRYIDYEKEVRTDLKIFPVPVINIANVHFTSTNTGMCQVEIVSSSGSTVYQAKMVCAEGRNSFSLNTANYSSGVYYLIIRSSSGEILNRKPFTK